MQVLPSVDQNTVEDAQTFRDEGKCRNTAKLVTQ